MELCLANESVAKVLIKFSLCCCVISCFADGSVKFSLQSVSGDSWQGDWDDYDESISERSAGWYFGVESCHTPDCHYVGVGSIGAL